MTTWSAIGVLAMGTFALRAAGPVVLARLRLRPRAQVTIRSVAPALLAALVGVSTFADGRALVVDARVVGVVVAVAAVWRRLPIVVVIAAAVATTAGLRALT